MHYFIINIDMNVNDLSKQKIFLLFMLKASSDTVQQVKLYCAHISGLQISLQTSSTSPNVPELK